uniref:Uncharacterized protein n=1 Tax=Romanomermis culicivorax TaxID=13658 RepID=A0A915J720_ROMCU
MELVRVFIDTGRMHLACLFALSAVRQYIIAAFLLTALPISGLALLSVSTVAIITKYGEGYY